MTTAMSMNDQKMAELEAAVEAHLSAASIERRGCFGTPLHDPRTTICHGCADREACGPEAEKNRERYMADVELALDAMVAEYEIAEELAPEPEVVEAPKAVRAPKAVEAPEPIVPETTVASADEIDLEAITIKGKVVDMTKIDFKLLVAEIVAQKPTEYKDVPMIIQEAVKISNPDIDVRSSSYNWANKILTGLAKQGAVEWAPKSREIKWLV